jgi:hypothetical protein
LSDYELYVLNPSTLRCAQSYTVTFTNAGGGVWTESIDASYQP